MQGKLTREKQVETILTLCVAFVVIYLLSKQHHRYWLTLSMVLGLIGMFWRYGTEKIAWAWMKLGEVIGAINSRIILTAVFFVVLVPVAAVSRLFGRKNDLQLKPATPESYYFNRSHKFEAKDLENSW